MDAIKSLGTVKWEQILVQKQPVPAHNGARSGNDQTYRNVWRALTFKW